MAPAKTRPARARNRVAAPRDRSAAPALPGSGPPPGAVPRAWSAALAAVLFGAYLALAPAVSGDKDASEFVLVLATGGVTHPTGYPVFVVLGHWFVLLLHALGCSFPYAANAWAAAGGGLALFFYHRLALRVLPAEPALGRCTRFALAALPALVLGFNPVWTDASTIVEVHSWHLAWACGTALYFAGLIERLTSTSPEHKGLGRRLAAWGFLCGLGGAHHTTAVFFAAGLTVALTWVLVRARAFRAWVPLAWLGAGALPLLSYGYLYFRALHPGRAEIWPMLEPSFRNFLDYVTARTYGHYLGGWNPEESQLALLRWWVYPFLWPGLALLAWFGIATRDLARQVLLVALLLSALAQLLFVYHYGVTDPAPYFLPCIAVALLALPLAGWSVLSRLPGRGRVFAGAAAAAALVLLAVTWVRTGTDVRRRLGEVDDLLHRTWLSIPYERGIVLWPHGSYQRLREYQLFRGEKRGLDIYHPGELCNDYPRAQFWRRYGFDPLASADSVHLAQPLNPEFVIGEQSNDSDRHGYALILETIVERAAVPVIGFDPPEGIRLYKPEDAP